MSDTPRPRIGIGAYVCHNGKILASFRTTANGHSTWSPPGGHLEFGEHWDDCAIREALEEVGIKAHSPQLFAVTNHVFPEKGKHYVTMHVALLTDTPDFATTEPDKHSKLGWYEWNEFPEPRMPEMQVLYDLNQKPPYVN